MVVVMAKVLQHTRTTEKRKSGRRRKRKKSRYKEEDRAWFSVNVLRHQWVEKYEEEYGVNGRARDVRVQVKRTPAQTAAGAVLAHL